MIKLGIIHLLAISHSDTWIINSETNKHMINSFKNFLTYFSFTKRENVCIADRSYTLVSETGPTNCTQPLFCL